MKLERGTSHLGQPQSQSTSSCGRSFSSSLAYTLDPRVELATLHLWSSEERWQLQGYLLADFYSEGNIPFDMVLKLLLIRWKQNTTYATWKENGTLCIFYSPEAVVQTTSLVFWEKGDPWGLKMMYEVHCHKTIKYQISVSAFSVGNLSPWFLWRWWCVYCLRSWKISLCSGWLFSGWKW